MSCGTKLTRHTDSYSDRHELSERLEREGEFRLAHDVRNGDCLSSYDLRRAESALERQGMQRNWDYRENGCHCSSEEEREEQF
jgi:hypothetical protein